MKKSIILALTALLFSVGASAQKYWDNSRPRYRMTIGPRVGLDFSKQTNKGDGGDRSFRTGFLAGAEIDVNIVRSFSINMGVLYIQKGYKDKYSDERGSLKITDKPSFIEVPLLLSYRIELSDQAQFQLNAGTYFAFGMSGKHKVKSTFAGQQDYDFDSFDDLDGMKKSDVGLVFGAALTFSNIYLGVNYERSLKNVSNVPGEKYHNSTIAIQLGYNFNFWK